MWRPIKYFPLFDARTYSYNLQGKTTEQRIDELRTSSAECWRAAETIWQITEDFQIESGTEKGCKSPPPHLGTTVFVLSIITIPLHHTKI
jgi:hypothetical protein